MNVQSTFGACKIIDKVIAFVQHTYDLGLIVIIWVK